MLTQTTRMLDTKDADARHQVGDAPEPRTVILNTRGTTTAYLRLLQLPAVRRAELNQLNNLHVQASTLLAIPNVSTPV